MRGSFVSFLLLFFILSSNLALAVTWSEVTQFSGGSTGQTTDHFICSHPEWRINWNYKPNSTDPTDAVFVIYVINDTGSMGAITQYGDTNTSGTSYIHNRQGEFYLQFMVENVESYSVIIEQDLDSVPEFSPLVFLSLSMTGILVAALSARRQGHLTEVSVEKQKVGLANLNVIEMVETLH